MLLLLTSTVVDAFSLARLRPCRRLVVSRLQVQPNFWERNEDTSEKFNPYGNQSNRVSLRDQRMQEINQQLLDADSKTIQRILLTNKEFLIEPLEDAQAVGSSMYAGCKTRAERYRVYETTINARIEAAKGNAVRNVLQALKEFVLSQE